MVVVVTACGAEEDSETGSEGCEASIKGTVTYPGWTELPEDAAVLVSVQDASAENEDLLLEALGYRIYRDMAERELPYAFEVCYDSDQIQEDVTYSVRVIIQKRFALPYGENEDLNPVITGGNPSKDIEIVVTPLALE